ncbi:hypothetical protein [Sphingomonas sp.]|uniref:hypothetical protein n=1 Tax=Sphingomonas sp. TaxID=28214 RepID=UPI003CC506D5
MPHQYTFPCDDLDRCPHPAAADGRRRKLLDHGSTLFPRRGAEHRDQDEQRWRRLYFS